MSFPINSSERSPVNYAQLQNAQTDTSKVVVVQGESRNVQSISELAKKGDMVSLMMEKQSLHPDMTAKKSGEEKRKGGEIDTHTPATSLKLTVAGEDNPNSTSAQKRNGGEIDTPTPAKSVKLMVAGEDDANKTSAQKRNGGETETDLMDTPVKVSAAGDIHKAEHLAALAPALLTQHLNTTQSNNKSAESSRNNGVSTVTSTSSSTGQASSYAAVEGGTDITATGPSGGAFTNLFGSMNLLQLSNKLTSVFWKQETDLNKMSADASIRAVKAAELSGAQIVEGAKDNRNGKIASGVLGSVAQGGLTMNQVKAVNKNINSLKTNMKSARNSELGVQQNQNAIKQGNMAKQNNPPSPDVEAVQSKPQARDIYDSALKRDKHGAVQQETQKAHMIGESGNQVIRSVQGVIEGSAGVMAADKQKMAGLNSADQDTNKALADGHTQGARKSAEANAAMRNMAETIFNANNSTASHVAQNTR